MSNRLFDVGKHLLMVGLVPISPGSLFEDAEIEFTFDKAWDITRDAGGGIHVYKKTGTKLSGMAKIPLHPDSTDNLVLSTLMQLGLLSSSSGGVFSFTSLQGIFSVTAEFCVVMPPEKITIGQKHTAREWPVALGGITYVDGGLP